LFSRPITWTKNYEGHIILKTSVNEKDWFPKSWQDLNLDIHSVVNLFTCWISQ
jgi:hypothetical protein